jgi:uncharacterized membrane protein YedE/YeeE
MVNAIIGGLFIGLAVSIMLLFNGRVTGISGIMGGIVKPKKNDLDWRLAFFIGLISGGALLFYLKPEQFVNLSQASTVDYIIAGLFVGFGTLLGNGCTSGHGVCGISRLSIRSILSTLTFIGFGVISVLIYKSLRGDL